MLKVINGENLYKRLSKIENRKQKKHEKPLKTKTEIHVCH